MRKQAFFAILIFALASCEKDQTVSSPVNNAQPSTFQEISVMPDFNWSTETEYSLQIVAMKNMPFSRVNMLRVTDADNNLVFQALVNTGETKVLKFKANRELNLASVSFGSISKEVTFSNYRGEFDFIPFDDQSDIEPENN